MKKIFLLYLMKFNVVWEEVGKLSAYNHYNLQPDIVALDKGIGAGLLLSGVLTNKKTSDMLHPGDHGLTFGGNTLQ